jgi:hypothetical protein
MVAQPAENSLALPIPSQAMLRRFENARNVEMTIFQGKAATHFLDEIAPSFCKSPVFILRLAFPGFRRPGRREASTKGGHNFFGKQAHRFFDLLVGDTAEIESGG